MGRYVFSNLSFYLCYNTFPAENVKKQPRSELVDAQIWNCKEIVFYAISNLSIPFMLSMLYFGSPCADLKNRSGQILYRICFEGQINGVLLPWRHGDPPFYYQCLLILQTSHISEWKIKRIKLVGEKALPSKLLFTPCTSKITPAFSTCCQKCKKCLLCLATIAEQLPVWM